MPQTSVSLRDLPRLRNRHLGQIGGLMRPGTHESPLLGLGERFVISPPGFPTMLVTYDMDDVRDLFTNHDDFSIGQVLSRFSSHDQMFGKQTLIFLDGDEHRRERKLFAPPFQSKALRSYEELMVEVVERELPKWPVGEEFEFLTAGYDLAIGVLLGVVFGDVAPVRRDRLERAVKAWFGEIESRGFLAVTLITPLVGGYTLPYPPLRRRQAEVDALIIEEIAARRATPGDATARKDVLSRYVGTELDQHDDAALARNMRGILLGAYETTAITLGWIAAMLAGHPAAMAELDAAIDAGDSARLDAYLDAVVAETMRLRPVSPFTGRRALRDTVINGVHIPKGAIVIVPILLIHESPRHYQDPMTFRPERFLDERPSGHTWLTFGAGPHRCLGAQFALAEARILFRVVLENRRIAPAPGPIEPPRRYHTGLSPVHNARITLLPR
ncbi:cytochrome P450 [Nocardia ninae]|uniref:Putative cytochrome P450 n=1 Tax=Nocardia ninae NBRC 108245 TaxID=1210091 RepID=A0A511MDZ1_9NOCA|nr:cytochrome P450 [Nocardia ninae]GEM38701.1 putative cytochrome P450 [Nocardia ninae NBRC 108245]